MTACMNVNKYVCMYMSVSCLYVYMCVVMYVRRNVCVYLGIFLRIYISVYV